MLIKIRTKLVFAVGFLVIILFSLAAYLLINEKRAELAHDMYINNLTFSRLSASSIAEDYHLYLEQNSFVYFNREIQKIFEQNDDLSQVKIISYFGELIYDSTQDIERRYTGKQRMLDDRIVVEQVRSRNLSVKTRDGRVVYFLINPDGTYSTVDFEEKMVASLEDGVFIEYFVVPISEEFALYFAIDYASLDARVNIMIERIVYLAIFGIMLGIIFSVIMASNLTKPVRQLVKGVEGIARGDFNTRVFVDSNDELSYLADAFNRMAKDLQSSIDARVYRERVTHELELVKEIQQQIVPEIVPKVNGLDIAADLIPASEIGGDMYDFLPSNENRFMFYLGDVTGHGVPAGILSSIASALFYGFSNMFDLKEIMIRVNSVFKEKTMANMFMTLCLLSWNAIDNVMEYVNAGHEQMIFYKKSDLSTSLLPSGGIALGMIDDISNIIKLEKVYLEQGDYLVIYSDGIPEAWRSKNETYGIARFQDSVRRNVPNCSSAVHLKDALIEDLKTFVSGYTQMDDVTIIVIKKL